MEKSLITDIRIAAANLKGGKLRNMQALAHVLGRIKEAAALATDDEAMALSVLMDRQCSDSGTTVTDLTVYFDCTYLEAMACVPALRALQAKGYLKADDMSEFNTAKISFMILPAVFNNIVEGREPLAGVQAAEATFDQFDYCRVADRLIHARHEGHIDTATLFNRVLDLEARYSHLPLVEGVKAVLADVTDRTLFYEACYDFQNESDGGASDLKDTLNSIYDRKADFLVQTRHFMEHDHTLLTTGLVELRHDDIALTDKGLELLFGKDAVLYKKMKGGLDRFEFVRTVKQQVRDLPDSPSSYEVYKMTRNVELLEEANDGLHFIHALRAMVHEAGGRMLYYLICYELVKDDNFVLCQLSDITTKSEEIQLRRQLKENKHPLQQTGLAELTGGGMFGSASVDLTEKGKRLYLEEDYDLFCKETSDNDLIPSDKITTKQLYFSGDTERQLRSLANSLKQGNYEALCSRLEQSHLPKGITVLLYGYPGTGKTESVLQLARQTGRAIYHVNIASTKSCWFGESERLIKEVFDDYRKLCGRQEVKPILLFNEADGIFSKRKDSASGSVAQTENAIQNIILEEMERLDGILVATTNLADNLDNAFERRFLFKIKFEKPGVEAKKQIWLSKLPALSPELAGRLAAGYDFSGGEIDNITRKVLVEELLVGTKITDEALITLCNDERPATEKRKIGF
ncbi:MAG: ATP-binding protein [Prevotellaceae bacterium]|nr:ATP-binding protein [Prevotellaceae bacterium]